MAEETKIVSPVADPGPLGLGALALSTFVLSVHNALGASAAPLLAFFGFAILGLQAQSPHLYENLR